MLLQGLLMLLGGYALERKNGRVGRRKVPYILREGIIANPEKYRLSCLKSKNPMQKRQK